MPVQWWPAMFRNCSVRRLCPSLAIILVRFVIASLPAYSQTPETTSSSSQIFSNVDEVSLDVIVKNKKDKPVLDLKPDDLAVTDGGTPVKLSALRLVGKDSSSQHQVILAFDRLNSANASNARKLAAKILKEIPANGFAISVMNVQSRLVLYQMPTADRALLKRAIAFATQPARPESQESAASAEKNLLALVRGGNSSPEAIPNPQDRPLAVAMLSALEQSQTILQEQHASPSLASLLALARIGRRLPGRKVVIYFSQSLPTNAAAQQILGTIVGTANRSSVSIYAIDVNSMSEQAAQGLLAMAAMGGAMHASAANQVSAPQAPTSAAGAPVHALGDLSTQGMTSMANDQYVRFETHVNETRSPLVELARGTGGAYISVGENPRKPIQQMIKDLSTYYEASYVPPIQDYDGQFRPVTVKSVRSGLKIKAKAGYYALPSEDVTGIRAFEPPLLKVLEQEQLPRDLKFNSGILQLGELATGYENALVVQVPVSELASHDDPNSNLYTAHVSVVAQIKNKAGQVMWHFSEDIPWHGSLDTKQKSGRSAILTMQRHFAASAGEYLLETAVLDHNSGKSSAVRSNFVISGQPSGPFLSDVALVDHMDPLLEELDPSEPLRYGSSKVVPNLSAQVPQGTKSISLFSLIHADPEQPEQPRLEMTVIRNGEPLAQAPLRLRRLDAQGAVPYVASIQTSLLPAGDYQIVETLTQGAKIAERSLSFRIDGPQLASANPNRALNNLGVEGNDPELALASASNLVSSKPTRPLAITALPPESSPSPTADDLDAFIILARKQALGYQARLPNFVCVEVTNRSVDSGNGNWKHRDSFAELLRYVDKQETRTMLERNGERSSLERTDLDSNWLISGGEFGNLLSLVFKPESKTQFEWKQAAILGSTKVSILSYRVARENGNITLNGNRTYGAGFHGLLYIDQATGGVLRITVEADDLPHDFSIHAANMTIDYDYVSIGTHEYLMPMRASVGIQRGRRQIDLNEMTFRNYRRYGSQAKVTFAP